MLQQCTIIIGSLDLYIVVSFSVLVHYYTTITVTDARILHQAGIIAISNQPHVQLPTRIGSSIR